MLVVAPLTAVALGLLLWRLHRRGGMTVLRVLVGVALCVYVAGIVANTVLPIYLDKPDSDMPWHAYLNLTPLADTEVADMVRNVVVFVPFGVLLPLVTGTRSVVRVVLSGFLLSLLMETAQLVNALVANGGHVADVNDLLANTLGAPIGYALLRLGERVPGVRDVVRAATWPPPRPRS
ncbi:VanZ family protein [Cellulomonas sp. S1-8]|uniref:VanZ family protein n=1 Tax=Cellulomonas sp. S1-8 TaxID=2904790 RepID=UPI002243613D|nr:VanZ family protein [Cellulomonas sp. S1-8]UZN03758.1 VanZ family protein [Cellulomonas sp. S1-8]